MSLVPFDWILNGSGFFSFLTDNARHVIPPLWKSTTSCKYSLIPQVKMAAVTSNKNSK